MKLPCFAFQQCSCTSLLLRQSAWITSHCHKGLYCRAEMKIFFFLVSNVTLIESQEWGSGFLWELLYHVMFWALWCGMSCKVSVNKTFKSEKKRNIFPDVRCAERYCRHSSFKKQSDETLSPMAINVEKEIFSNLCALILGTLPWLAYSPTAQFPSVVFRWFAQRYIFKDLLQL